jgi:hypothetical protein
MPLIGKPPYNPNAYVPPVNIDLGSAMRAPIPESFAQLPTMAPPKPGFFGRGGAGRAIAGSIGDFLLQLNRMQPIYGPITERRREEQSAFERGEQQWQAHHKQDVADQMALLDYKRLHPDDELSQRLDQAGITDPVQRRQYYTKALEKSTQDDPFVTLTLPGDRIYSGPRSGIAAALTGSVPSAASPMSGNVPTVSDAAGYNALPPGARFKGPDGHIRIKGGQTQPASGGFR